jgi:hypothetical protein
MAGLRYNAFKVSCHLVLMVAFIFRGPVAHWARISDEDVSRTSKDLVCEYILFASIVTVKLTPYLGQD